MAALTEKEKRELDATRRENGIKNMYYTLPSSFSSISTGF